MGRKKERTTGQVKQVRRVGKHIHVFRNQESLHWPKRCSGVLSRQISQSCLDIVQCFFGGLCKTCRCNAGNRLARTNKFVTKDALTTESMTNEFVVFQMTGFSTGKTSFNLGILIVNSAFHISSCACKANKHALLPHFSTLQIIFNANTVLPQISREKIANHTQHAQ